MLSQDKIYKLGSFLRPNKKRLNNNKKKKKKKKKIIITYMIIFEIIDFTEFVRYVHIMF